MGSYHGNDVDGMLSFVGIVLLVLAVLVTAVVLWNRWRQRRGKGSSMLTVDWTLAISGFWVMSALIAIPVGVVRTMTSRAVSIEDFPFRVGGPDGSFTCNQPIGTGSARIECLNVTTGDATVSGLSAGVRTLLATDQVLWILLGTLPAVALGIICFQLLRGRPFTRTVTWTLLGSAIAVLVLGFAAAVFDGLSRSAASASVLPPESTDAALTATGDLILPFWPIGAALALLAMSAVFRYGAKLQRDTELLV